MLDGYRVLDLTDATGYFCGKILGDLGADVIKIERSGGDPGRDLGPFCGGQPGKERSLYWMAFNTSKRGITLDIERPRGRDLLRQLVATADFLVESFPPGYLDQLGLGYPELGRIAPGLIMASITPFGQTGPRKDYQGSDLVAMALSGVASVIGDPDRAPLRFCLDQGYLVAGTNAAIGCLIALFHRQRSGLGQHVDISLQESLLRLYCREFPQWEFRHSFMKRMGTHYPRTDVAFPGIFPCRDGHVTWLMYAGPAGAEENRALVRWMEEEGFAEVEALRQVDWDLFDYAKVTQQQLDAWYQVFVNFFSRHTRRELEEGASRRRIRLVAINSVSQAVASPHLAARGAWVEVEHPALELRIRYPGRALLLSEGEGKARRPAPGLGEHNQDVYCGELGLSTDELGRLRAEGVI